MFKLLARSLFFLLFWTSIAGYAAWIVSESVYISIGVCVLALLAQFWLSGVQRAVLEKQQFTEKDEQILEFVEQAKKGGSIVQLSCAACHNHAPVAVSYAEPTSYTCPHCKQLNKVYVQFTTVRATTPLVSSNGTMVPIDEEDEKEFMTQNVEGKLEITQ